MMIKAVNVKQERTEHGALRSSTRHEIFTFFLSAAVHVVQVSAPTSLLSLAHLPFLISSFSLSRLRFQLGVAFSFNSVLSFSISFVLVYLVSSPPCPSHLFSFSSSGLQFSIFPAFFLSSSSFVFLPPVVPLDLFHLHLFCFFISFLPLFLSAFSILIFFLPIASLSSVFLFLLCPLFHFPYFSPSLSVLLVSWLPSARGVFGFLIMV